MESKQLKLHEQYLGNVVLGSGPAVLIYDTTLRDGNQSKLISWSVEDKLYIARRLAELGVDYIEGGYAGANPKDDDFFKQARNNNYRNARIAAFGSTCRPQHSKDPSGDGLIRKLLEAETPTVTIFGKSSVSHVKYALRTDRRTNLRMIKKSVAYLAKEGKEVIYDAEHFFRGFKENSHYALKTLEAALDGGADFIVLCDTNGWSTPFEVYKIVHNVKHELKGTGVELGIHTHNDRGLAQANTLAAVKAGARMVQGTMNGFGERVGNDDVLMAIANLYLQGYTFNENLNSRLQDLTSTSIEAYDRANLEPVTTKPFFGGTAFSHKGGGHVSAVNRNAGLYEGIEPETFGNERRIVMSDYGGRANIIYLLRHYGMPDDHPKINEMISTIKSRESVGYVYEGADASLELLIRRIMGEPVDVFTLNGLNVVTKRDSGGREENYAVLHLTVNDSRIRPSKAYGDGPVNAMDIALRKALRGRFPELDELVLDDYKVRAISNGTQGTASSVRVFIESQFRDRRFGTVGVGPNQNVAGWEALADSYTYGILLARKNKEVAISIPLPVMRP